jgi:hypothetical protein
MKNFCVNYQTDLRHMSDQDAQPYLCLTPNFNCHGDKDTTGDRSHISVMTILSIADAVAIRDDLTKALIEIDAWQRAQADKVVP